MGSVAEQLRPNNSAALPAHLPVNFICDGCSARATYEVRLPSGGILILCGHHANRHMDALVTQGATVFAMDSA